MSENIHQAINKVMEDVGYVKKQKGANLNYTYAGEAALISALRPAMVENGVYMHVLKIESVTRENYTTSKGTAMTNTVISAIIRFAHVSGTFIDVASTGEGSDAGDKSANKAMTGLYKYAMRQTFCIETGDDPDKHASEPREATKESKPVTKVANEIITQSEWETFTALQSSAKEAGVKVPDYQRANMTPASIDGATKYLKQELAKAGKK